MAKKWLDSIFFNSLCCNSIIFRIAFYGQTLIKKRIKMDYELTFLKCLVLTILIETIVLIIFFRLIVKTKEIEISKLLITGFVASFATLPYLWFIFPNYIDHTILYMLTGESFAVLVEAVIIGAILRVKFIQSFLCSLTCNMISFFIGLIISWT